MVARSQLRFGAPMTVQITHKRSETAGAQPQISDLQFGEFGINAADGDVFLKGLIDPTAATITANQIILSIRKPRLADGGVITAPTESAGTPFMLAELLDGLYNYDWYRGF